MSTVGETLDGDLTDQQLTEFKVLMVAHAVS